MSKRPGGAGDAGEGGEALARLGVEEHGVAVAEGAAAHVLPGDAHRGLVGEERRVGQHLAGAPVEGLAAHHRRVPGVEDGEHLGVGGEALGQLEEARGELADALGAHRGGHLGRGRVEAAAVARPHAAHGVGHRREAALLHVVEGGGEGLAALDHDLVGAVLGDVAHLEEALHVHLAHRRLAVDGLVHERLGVARLVALVVAVAAVAVHVDDDVHAEALPPLGGEVGGLGHGLRVLPVDVEDGDLEHPRDVGGVAGGAAVLGVGGEADLVVDDDVDRAARGVAGQPGEVQRLGDDALAHEGGVAVDEQRQDPPARGGIVAHAVLLGAGAALDDGVDELEVAGVERHRQVHALARRGSAVARVPEVVLHVAAAEEALGVGVLERGEDLAHALAHEVGHDVEAPAVGHAEDDLLGAVLGRLLDDEVAEGDEALRALEREALGPRAVAAVDELLEDLGVAQLGEDAELLLLGEGQPVPRGLHALLEPVALLGILDGGVLDADGAAVRLLQGAEDLAQGGHRGHAGEVDGGEGLVEVLREEVEVAEVELGRGVLGRSQGVDVGEEVPADPVSVEELVDPRLDGRLGEDVAVVGVARRAGRDRRQDGGREGVVQAVGEVAVGERKPGRAGKQRAPVRRRGEPRVEVGAPSWVHGGGVLQVLGVELFDEAGVDAEIQGHRRRANTPGAAPAPQVRAPEA